MKINTAINVIVSTLSVFKLAKAQQSPFYYQDDQDNYQSKYKISGKMEQIGRTGVAAMHAVLLK
jgi:hypothetical protein